LLDEPLYAPKLTKAERAAAEAELARAHAAYTAKPSGPAEILALQQAHLALGRIGDALVVLTHGIEANPGESALYLERGRGYLMIRKFSVAERDLRKAAEKLPAARCALGFAHYLSGDYERARAAYADCRDTGVFGYLAARRAGHSAARPPAPEGPIPTTSQPITFPGTVKKADAPEPLAASYLAAIERLLAGEEDDALERLKKIVERNRNDWMDPAYVAAEADYARLKKPAKNKKR
jgi:tetratricopeptide (TPR) repeat protein